MSTSGKKHWVGVPAQRRKAAKAQRKEMFLVIFISLFLPLRLRGFAPLRKYHYGKFFPQPPTQGGAALALGSIV
jgi:hypothetical protein